MHIMIVMFLRADLADDINHSIRLLSLKPKLFLLLFQGKLGVFVLETKAISVTESFKERMRRLLRCGFSPLVLFFLLTAVNCFSEIRYRQHRIIELKAAEQHESSSAATAAIPSDTIVTSNQPEETIFEKGKMSPKQQPKTLISDHPMLSLDPSQGYNVVLTHSTADFDSLASAVGLAKLWSTEAVHSPSDVKPFDSASHVPTYVVLPRGAHPSVQRFLSLHKHLFPIRSLKSLPSPAGRLNRLALVDAQRKERLIPAEGLLEHAKRITVVDHHVDQDSDIAADDYVVDKVGSVTTLIAERLQQQQVSLTEAEATLLALGIHADTGNLCFDNTTPRDAYALAWCLSQGASQTAIAEHVNSPLSPEQQSVLTRALLHVNTTVVNGVTISTVLLQADAFIQGLAAVTQDALELSSSDIFLMGLVYGSSKRKDDFSVSVQALLPSLLPLHKDVSETEQFLRDAFRERDLDQSGDLDATEISRALNQAGVVTTPSQIQGLVRAMDTDGDGQVDCQEFVDFVMAQQQKQQQQTKKNHMIVIGRVKASANLKDVKLNHLLEPFGGGGHPKAASATLRVSEETQAAGILQSLVDQLVEHALPEQATVADFMMSPVLSVTPDMTEVQVERLFTRLDVRALPVINPTDNTVIGLVTYKEVAAAKQRLWNKEQKRLQQEQQALEKGAPLPVTDEKHLHTTVKAWMKQHFQTVAASATMQDVELILMENDIGCIPVVETGTQTLVGMVTRTDLLRHHRYYPSLPYHNKGMADSIAARKPMIELRKRLKQFDIE